MGSRQPHRKSLSIYSRGQQLKEETYRHAISYGNTPEVASLLLGLHPANTGDLRKQWGDVRLGFSPPTYSGITNARYFAQFHRAWSSNLSAAMVGKRCFYVNTADSPSSLKIVDGSQYSAGIAAPTGGNGLSLGTGGTNNEGVSEGSCRVKVRVLDGLTNTRSNFLDLTTTTGSDEWINTTGAVHETIVLDLTTTNLQFDDRATKLEVYRTPAAVSGIYFLEKIVPVSGTSHSANIILSAPDEVLTSYPPLSEEDEDKSVPPASLFLTTSIEGTVLVVTNADKYTIQFSDTFRDEPETFPAVNLFRVSENNDPIVEMMPAGKVVVVLTTGGLYEIRKSGTFLTKKTIATKGYGTHFRASVVAFGDLMAWIGFDTIWMYRPESGQLPVSIGDPIRDWVLAANKTSNSICGGYHAQLHALVFSNPGLTADTGRPDQTKIFDLRTQTWKSRKTGYKSLTWVNNYQGDPANDPQPQFVAAGMGDGLVGKTNQAGRLALVMSPGGITPAQDNGTYETGGFSKAVFNDTTKPYLTGVASGVFQNGGWIADGTPSALTAIRIYGNAFMERICQEVSNTTAPDAWSWDRVETNVTIYKISDGTVLASGVQAWLTQESSGAAASPQVVGAGGITPYSYTRVNFYMPNAKLTSSTTGAKGATLALSDTTVDLTDGSVGWYLAEDPLQLRFSPILGKDPATRKTVEGIDVLSTSEANAAFLAGVKIREDFSRSDGDLSTNAQGTVKTGTQTDDRNRVATTSAGEIVQASGKSLEVELTHNHVGSDLTLLDIRATIRDEGSSVEERT